MLLTCSFMFKDIASLKAETALKGLFENGVNCLISIYVFLFFMLLKFIGFTKYGI